jgi:hypothetical protein
MKNRIYFFVVFVFITNLSSGQGLSKLSSCTTEKCVANWIIGWEKSFINELSIASKLRNRENRRNKVINIMYRYCSPIYNYEKGPIRSHLMSILRRKDMPEEDIDYYANKLDEAYDRTTEAYKKALNGEL